jgi:integrase/recombinase XerD
VRNFVEKTRNDYIRHVRTFTAFLGRSPDTATPEDLRRFQLHLVACSALARIISLTRAPIRTIHSGKTSTRRFASRSGSS